MPWVAVPVDGGGGRKGALRGPLAGGGTSVRIAYSVCGSGPVLAVLVPGLCVPRGMYDALAARLAGDGRFTAVWLDNRGMGGSGSASSGWSAARLAEDAWAVADHARAALAHRTRARVALVGHSMGGMIVQRMAAQRPLQVGLLALLSTHAGGLWNLVPTRTMLAALCKLAWHRFAPRVRAGVAISLHFTDRYLDAEVKRRADIMRRYLAGADQDFGEAGPEQAEEGGASGAEAVLRGHLNVVRGHSLQATEAGKLAGCERLYKVVLAGRSDCVIAPSASRRLANAIGANVVVEIEGAHFIVEEAREAVIANLFLGLDEAYGGGGDGDGRVTNVCACQLCSPGKRESSSYFETFRMC